MRIMNRTTLLGGMSPHAFMRRHWQKQPKLIRGAIPGFGGLITLPELQRIAARDDVESRLVARNAAGHGWTLAHGPFRKRDFDALPASRWTLLVQGLNHIVPAADALLRRFSFISYARLDDVMVSYAAPGGGAGPHIDSYDVFLLQGMGTRRWRISSQRGLALDPHAPLKILRGFEPREQWLLEAGDMLYLPPDVAHDGVAVDACMTFSVGARAPSRQELAQEFLGYLQERLDLAGMVGDRGLRPARHPGEIPAAMVDASARLLGGIRWTRASVADFLGSYLSTPKPHIVFDSPPVLLDRTRFSVRARAIGVRLDPKSIFLFRGRNFFLNGEVLQVPLDQAKALRVLADTRRHGAHETLPAPLLALLHRWYCAGFLQLGDFQESDEH